MLRNAFGRQTDSFECDLEVRGVTDARRESSPHRPMRAVFIRAPLLLDCGPDVDILAARRPGRRERTARGRAPGPGAGASFHPELTDDLRLHAYFLSLIR